MSAAAQSVGGGRIWSPYQRAVFEHVDKSKRHLIVEALAGSGKTSTIVEALFHTAEHESVLMVAFNKAIADELKTRAPGDVAVMTLHSYGLHQIRAAHGDRKIDGYHVSNILRETLGRSYDLRDVRAACAKVVSLGKSHITNMRAHRDDLLERLTLLADSFGVFVPKSKKARREGATLDRSMVVVQALATLQGCAKAVDGPLDFDDMVWLPIVQNLECDNYDRVFVDETQDLNAVQLELVLKACAEGGQIVAVGDRHQCHPAGTMIELTGGTRKPIEEIVVGDELVTYHDCFRGIASQGRKVERTAVSVAEQLLGLHVGDAAVVVTPEHRVPTRLALTEDKWAVYLMRKGATSRIGSCQVNYSHGFGPAMRARQERADCLWVLSVFNDKEEAQISETVTALRYGLPENCFFEKGHLKDRLLAAIGDNSMQANRCLRDHGREVEHPLYSKADPKHIGRYLYITQACNLISGLNELRTFDGSRDGGAWAPVRVVRAAWPATPVYSLQVEPTEGGHRLYVANRVLVHNSIYGFRGAAEDAIPRMIRRLDAEVLPLSITYRCPLAVVAEAQVIVPALEPHDDAADGTVRTVTADTMTAEAAPGDFVISRTNAELVHHCLTWIAAGKRAVIRGRDIGANLISVINQTGAESCAELRQALSAWSSKEATRLIDLDRQSAANAVLDTAACIDAIVKGQTTIAGVKAMIESLFVADGFGGAIQLMSTHKSKGLEADRVWLLRDTFCRWEGQEEMNLLYVGITRAKSELNYVVA